MNIEPKKYKGSINLYKDSFIELSEFIKVKLNYEKRANQSNFDSGIPIEDYIRNEIKKLLPPKYAVTSGTIVDKDHNTCGDCDIIIFDNFSSPLIKNPSTYDSRRKIIPYESVYGIIEIKQRYNTGVLDKNGNLKDDADTNIITACEKIAMFKKLSRNQIFNRVDLPGFAINESKVLNRPFGYILCLDGPEDFKIVQKEIRRISENISRNQRTDGLFILDKYAFTWLYSEDIESKTKLPIETNPENANGNTIIKSKELTLYYLFMLILGSIRDQKLEIPDLYNNYGGKEDLVFDLNAFFPTDRDA